MGFLEQGLLEQLIELRVFPSTLAETVPAYDFLGQEFLGQEFLEQEFLVQLMELRMFPSSQTGPADDFLG